MTHMMAPLQALQASFQRHLLDGSVEIASAVVAGHGAGTARRLQIYHRAYRARLTDALRDTFGHSARYLGDDWFDADALAFIEATPSTHASLNDYGAGLPVWWAARYPQDPDIAELATLDWALRRAFDGPDAPVLTLAGLAAVAPEAWGRIGFVLHPTYRRLVFTHNTLALWSALDQEQAPPAAALLPVPTDLLVWRRGHQPHFRSLGVIERVALDALHAGASFATLCADLAAQYPQADIVVEAGSLLRRWVEEELLSASTEPLTAVGK